MGMDGRNWHIWTISSRELQNLSIYVVHCIPGHVHHVRSQAVAFRTAFRQINARFFLLAEKVAVTVSPDLSSYSRRPCLDSYQCTAFSADPKWLFLASRWMPVYGLTTQSRIWDYRNYCYHHSSFFLCLSEYADATLEIPLIGLYFWSGKVEITIGNITHYWNQDLYHSIA